MPFLNESARRIWEWARSKGFFTPDIRKRTDFVHWDNGPFLTHGDAMLGKLMLVVRECAEAAEAVRKGDEANFREEIVDAINYLFDIAASSGIDLDTEFDRKLEILRERPPLHGKATQL